MTDRLTAQFAFLNEADRLKNVLRATTLCDGSRRENSGEHSWHLALYAMVLADHAAPGVDLDRVIRMLILHDLVEIDVGDVPIHSANGLAHGSAAIQAAEARAANRIFGLLPMTCGMTFGHCGTSSRPMRAPMQSLPKALIAPSRSCRTLPAVAAHGRNIRSAQTSLTAESGPGSRAAPRQSGRGCAAAPLHSSRKDPLLCPNHLSHPQHFH